MAPHHEMLDCQEARRFRSVSRRHVHLSAERTQRHEELAKKVARSSADNRRVVWWFVYQREPKDIHCYTANEHEGCALTRQNTSGGLILYGRHLIHTWIWSARSSSAESEFYAMLQGGAEAFREQSVQRGSDESWPPDSSAARAVATHTGVGSVKHFDIRML